MDTNEGVGGSYLLNPKTGKRVLIERTKDAADKAVSVPEPKPETETIINSEE